MKLEINTPSYNYYAYSDVLVAIERVASKAIGKTFKKYKKAELVPEDIVIKGFPFVLDKEYETLKIDFTKEQEYKIKNLEKAAIS